MNHKKLQILVPQYKEDESVISYLLDSLECQFGIDKNDFGVIICSDGGVYELDRKIFEKYTYDIEYIICEHRGVSGTRNSALLLSDADYVMFCDADDGFCNTFALKVILRNLELHKKDEKPMDIMSCKFFLETYDSKTDDWGLTIMNFNNIYVHGRIFRRDFLIQNSLFFNEKIWANEDCFFNIITNFFSENSQNLDLPIYCWRCNDKSVSRDPDFLFKTLHQLILSNDSVVEMMILRGDDETNIAYTIFDLICKLYLDFSKPGWNEERNKKNRDITLKTLRWFIEKNGSHCSILSPEDKRKILQTVRGTDHYQFIETMTFDDFIKMVMNYE